MLGGILNKKLELPWVHTHDLSRPIHTLLTVLFLYPWTMLNSVYLLIEITLLGVGATLAIWIFTTCDKGRWFH